VRPNDSDKWIIYGSNSCPFCTKAVKFLTDLKEPYRYIDVNNYGGSTIVKENLSILTCNYTMIPLIFNYQCFIGGYTDLEKYVNNKKHIESYTKMMGGIGDKQAVSEFVHHICDHVKEKLESELGKNLDTFEPLYYKHQVVAGMNYFIKIRVEENVCVHVRVFRSLQGDINYTSHVYPKTIEDSLEYF